MDNDFRYDDKPWPSTDAKEMIFNLLPKNSRVLDLGCWTGKLGEKLKNKKNCYVAGCDINEKALKIAQKRLNKTFLTDLDEPDTFLKKSLSGKFDFIVAADVLEHLKDPNKILRTIPQFMDKNSRLMVSLPNIALWVIRLKFLLGKFEYEKTGILDETHLHFFTKKTAEKLLATNGFIIEKFFFTGRQFFPSLNAFQFVFVCKQ